MAVDRERAAYVALALTPGIGAARMSALLSHFQTATGALSAPFAFLCTVPGITRAAATAISETSAAAGERALMAVDAMGAFCILPDDPPFPAALKEIPDPPTLIFAQGQIDLLKLPGVAIVGSRDHSPYGAEVCREVAREVAEAGIAVVSGMARGLDAIAHTAALDAGGATIGLLGNGLGVVYPAANRVLYRRVSDEGLLLTEFPPGERPGVGAFPRRNRLISGLARVTVVIEAAEGSGTLITVGTALAQGRDVMAVPGNISSPTSIGTNRLIRDGAEPLLEVADLLAHYPEVSRVVKVEGRRPSAPRERGARPGREGGSGQAERPATRTLDPPPDLPPVERALFEMVRGGPVQLDDLIAASKRTAAEVLAALSSLELRGLLVQVAGQIGIAPVAV
jgi:DNA processing protein